MGTEFKPFDLDALILVGSLHCDHGLWKFKYTNEFKNHSEYNRIIGFKDLDKVYRNDTLWPFFQTHIPGLKQPAVQEIIEKEKDKKQKIFFR